MPFHLMLEFPRTASSLVEVVLVATSPRSGTSLVSVGPTWMCCSSASDASYDVVYYQHPMAWGIIRITNMQQTPSFLPLLKPNQEHHFICWILFFLLDPVAGLFHLAENGFF